ncbi:MAG: fumarylacetoacetate hydrolase family protein [Hyphomicrobiaceae bacterium]
MGYVIAPPQIVSLPVEDSQLRFPVHRVYCVGRNYADHAREMGHDPTREPPFFFQKNPQNLRTDGCFPIPPLSSDVQYEIEMAVCLSGGGDNIPESEALARVYGYAVALDMTRRDLQGEAKKLGRPWEVGKAFEHSAPVTAIRPASKIGHPAAGTIWLDQNSARRQSGDLSQMIWSVPEQIAHLSRLFTLAAGDVILTGTPAGVGRVARGDRLVGEVEGVGRLEVEVV